MTPIDNEDNCGLKESYNGCCCVCVFQVAIRGSMTNKHPEVNKAETVGYGCKVFHVYDNSAIIFSDHKHGMCEEFYRDVRTTPFYKVFKLGESYIKDRSNGKRTSSRGYSKNNSNSR